MFLLEHLIFFAMRWCHSNGSKAKSSMTRCEAALTETRYLTAPMPIQPSQHHILGC